MAGDTIVTVVGNVTADPELRFTQQGAAVVSFTVASTPRYFDKASGEWKDGDALFMRCNAWRQLAENAAESFKRGDRVMVSGQLKQRSFETKEGEKRTVMELTVDEMGHSIRFHPARSMRAERSSGQQQQAQQQRRAPVDDDPWGSTPPASQYGSSNRNTASSFLDEPPF